MNWYKRAKLEEDTLSLNKNENWKTVDSSFIDRVSYNIALRTLTIGFKNGKSYDYLAVPLKIYKNFLRSKSKGEFFNRVILKKYKQK